MKRRRNEKIRSMGAQAGESENDVMPFDFSDLVGALARLAFSVSSSKYPRNVTKQATLQQAIPTPQRLK